MYWWLKWILILCFAIWIGYHRHCISKLPRSRTNGSSNVPSSYVNITDEYQFYNRTEQYQNGYLEFKYIVYKDGLCGNLQIPPKKRPCTSFLHLHPYQTENFLLLQGQLSYQLGDKLYSCDIHTCSSPILVPPLVPHNFWMSDNKEDLILIVHIEPIYKDHGLRAASFENVAGVRRDKHMTIWQVFVLLDDMATYPTSLPLSLIKLIIKTGSLIGQLLGYKGEYEEYTTNFSEIN